MKKIITTRNRAPVLLAFAGLLVSNAAAATVDLIFAARPQFASNSCRSYAIVLAAGTLPNSPIPVSSVQDLRAAERDMQLRLEATAKQMGGSMEAGSHEVWKRAVEEMTSGKLQAVIEYKPTIEGFYERLEE